MSRGPSTGRRARGGAAYDDLHARIAEAQIDRLRVRRMRQKVIADVLAVGEVTTRLLRIDRYERRAWSRRKFAIREFDAAACNP